MRRIPDAPDEPASSVQPAFAFTATARHRAGRSDDALGLDCLARTLDQAALNMGLLSVDGALEAARAGSPRDAADAARRLADQITGQLKGLETALAEVALPARR